MASKEPPLDEIQWKSPFTAMEMQAMFNPNMMPLIQTREAFEGRLKTMTGLEFIVAHEPTEMAPGTGTGVWVIRKQTRRKKQEGENEVQVHSSYFVVGENIYMAPSIADVIASRTLSIISSLNNFFSLASPLPSFSPAAGHTYLPPAKKLSLPPNQSTLAHSCKEETPHTEITQTKNTIQSFDTSTNANTLLMTRLLEDSINIYLKYGDECMDENPITGEPDAFHLSSTGRKEKEKPAASQIIKGPLQLISPTSLKSEISSNSKERKGERNPKSSSGGKPKRKKSRIEISNTNSI